MIRRAPGPRDAKGQAAAEFALVLPLLAFLVLAVLQAALVARDQVLVVHAARAAVREASVGADSDRVRDAAWKVVAGADVEVSAGPEIGDPVEVSVRYVSRTALPLVGPLLPDPELRARAVMRRER